MSTSGTYTFGLANSSIILEAFDRCGIRAPMNDRHMLLSARTSLNLELLTWSNETFNYWKTVSGTINLVAGQATYTLPANLVTLEELYYSGVNQNGAGVNQDRIMMPIQRTQYAQIVNKLQQGIPTQYWFQMLTLPQITVWEVPAPGQAAPQYVLSWYGLQQIQDANLGSGETPDVPYRAMDALCARLAFRLAEKFAPAQAKDKAAIAEMAWDKLQRRDQEPGPIQIQPNVGVYGIMR